MQTVEQMVEAVYDQTDLGDQRRNQSLLQVATACVHTPGKSFGQLFGEWKDVKRAYRLIENEKVKSRHFLDPLEQAGGEACRGQSKIYALQDTTQLDFSHREPVTGLGPLHHNDRPGQGLLLHSTVAVDESGTPLGLLGVQSWRRDPKEQGKKYTRQQRPVESKESYKWLEGMKRAQQSIASTLEEGAQPRVIHVMDREGDMFDVFDQAYALGQGVVVRAAWDRRVGEAHLWETLRGQPAAGRFTIQIPSKPGQSARSAQVELRWKHVIVNPPQTKGTEKAPIGVYAVWVVEPNPPAGVKPLEWMLLTTEPVESLEDAVAIKEAYRYRWRVEELHLILKSGCRIEHTQFHSREKIEKILALFLLSALRILILRYLAETEPETSADEVLDQEEQEALRVYVRQQFRKSIGPHLTVGEVRYWIGRIGGHLGRKRDGQPGVRTLWRGWRDFETIVTMFQAMNPP